MLLETSRRYNPGSESITFLKDFSYNREDFAKAGENGGHKGTGLDGWALFILGPPGPPAQGLGGCNGKASPGSPRQTVGMWLLPSVASGQWFSNCVPGNLREGFRRSLTSEKTQGGTGMSCLLTLNGAKQEAPLKPTL